MLSPRQVTLPGRARQEGRSQHRKGNLMDAHECLQAGKLREALDQVKDQVRGDPAAARHRILLFQLLAVYGEWDKALNQLNVLGDLDAATLPMVQAYREALRCEALRARVFAGEHTPLIFGEPEQWVAEVVQALQHGARGKHSEAQALREKALEEAPTSKGTLDGEPFEWLADADSRLGPILEMLVDGKYYWVPVHRLRKVNIDAPEDLRDMVWLPAQVCFANGGQKVALIPTRYPGSEGHADPLVALSRKTVWEEVAAGVYHGLGQRMWATDQKEYSLLDVRELVLETGTGVGDGLPAQDGGDG